MKGRTYQTWTETEWAGPPTIRATVFLSPSNSWMPDAMIYQAIKESQPGKCDLVRTDLAKNRRDEQGDSARIMVLRISAEFARGLKKTQGRVQMAMGIFFMKHRQLTYKEAAEGGETATPTELSAFHKLQAIRHQEVLAERYRIREVERAK